MMDAVVPFLSSVRSAEQAVNDAILSVNRTTHFEVRTTARLRYAIRHDTSLSKVFDLIDNPKKII